MAFKTDLLPESYDILDHVSINKNRGRKWNRPRKRSFHQWFRSKFHFRCRTST
jgi:hypothetical protein